MEHPLFFLCPSCFSESSFERSRCLVCHSRIDIRKNEIIYDGQRIKSTDYYDLLFERLSIQQTTKPQEINLENLSGLVRISQKATLRKGNSRFEFKGYHRIFKRVIETPQPICEGHLVIFKNRIEFLADSEKLSWHAHDLTCITTNGHYFEFKVKHQPFYQVRFLEESQLKYEIIFRKWLNEFYRNSNVGEVIEFQPRLMFSPPEKSKRVWDFSRDRVIEKNRFMEKILLSLVKFKVGTALRLWIKVRIFSKENWNAVRTGFTILNHQSAFDPFIIGAFLDRKIAFLTKSTSFTRGIPRFFLRWLMGVPTTRYRPDPEVIYSIRRLLQKGIRIGIFAEGERTWGGRIQPFKMSLVKLLMASREAITPIIIKNAFHFWPRWAKFPRRAEVEIQVGAPFCLIPEIYSVDEQRKFLEEYFKTRLDED
jgi:1-acyl-sn-glycerol-3-phosphate acyltransferase